MGATSRAAERSQNAGPCPRADRETDPLAKPRHAGRPDAQRSPNTDMQRNQLEEPMRNEPRPGMSGAQTTRLSRAYNPENLCRLTPEFSGAGAAKLGRSASDGPASAGMSS